MAAETVTCPYCNAYVQVARPSHSRVHCSRCGETFAYRPREARAEGEEEKPVADQPTGDVPWGSPASRSADEQRRSNRTLALTVVALMAVMGAAALVYALKTRQVRRSHDFPTPPPPQGTALDYLPADINLLAVVRVREAVQTGAGKQIADLLPLGPSGRGAEPAQGKTGLEPENIDSLVVGLRADAGQVRPTVILQTRQPVDGATVRQALQLGERFQRNGRTLYKGVPDKLHVGVVAWFPSDTVLVMALNAEDLDRVPPAPSWSPDSLAPQLRGLVKERVEGKSTAWAVGSAEAWKPWLPALPAKERVILGEVSTFDVSLQLGQDVLVKAGFDCADETAARAVADYLHQVRVGGAQLSETQQGRRVTVEVRAEVDAIRKLLSGQASSSRGFSGRPGELYAHQLRAPIRFHHATGNR